MLRRYRFWLFIIAALILLITSAMTQAVASSNKAEPKIYVDNVLLTSDVPPLIESGTTLIPFRVLFEALGAQVLWDEDNRVVLGVYRTTAVRIMVGSEKIEINGRISNMALPAKVHSGRTMIPLRTVSEAFGFKVGWDGVNKAVYINSPQAAELKFLDGRNLLEIDFSKLPEVFPHP